jgi:excisionase family DNA binding protein
MTTKEAGRLLGVSDSRVRQFIKRGRLVPEKMGHISILRREDVEAFARLQAEEAPNKPGPKPNVLKKDADAAPAPGDQAHG